MLDHQTRQNQLKQKEAQERLTKLMTTQSNALKVNKIMAESGLFKIDKFDDGQARVSFKLIDDVKMSILVSMSETEFRETTKVKSAQIENKNSRHFTENTKLLNYPDQLQAKLNLIIGK